LIEKYFLLINFSNNKNQKNLEIFFKKMTLQIIKGEKDKNGRPWLQSIKNKRNFSWTNNKRWKRQKWKTMTSSGNLYCSDYWIVSLFSSDTPKSAVCGFGCGCVFFKTQLQLFGYKKKQYTIHWVLFFFVCWKRSICKARIACFFCTVHVIALFNEQCN